MTPEDSPLSPTTAVLLQHEREIPPLSTAVRARALTRARAAVVAAPLVRIAPVAAASKLRWAAAAAITCAAAAAGASAYELRTRIAPSRASSPAISAPTNESMVPRAPATAPPVAEPETPRAVNRNVDPTRTPAARTVSPLAGPDELRLLSRAREAVSRGDFATALSPIAEHARRFRDGRLSEEREALRVKALAGLGRGEEARRAAIAFERRFPHSVLLPAVTRLPGGR